MKNRLLQNILAVFIPVWSLGSTNLSAQQENSSPEPVNITTTYTTEVVNINKVKTLIIEIESNTELDKVIRTKLLSFFHCQLNAQSKILT